MKIYATLLPIRSVGVQGKMNIRFDSMIQLMIGLMCVCVCIFVLCFCRIGDCRSYSYVLGLSTEEDPDWNDLLFLAKLIPRILHNINRVCYIFGGPVQFQISDITETKISQNTLAQLRQADHLANTVRHYLYYLIYLFLFFHS